MRTDMVVFVALFGTVLGLPGTGRAQSPSLEGRVLDSVTDAPVGAAEVRLTALRGNLEFRTETLPTGVFLFFAVAPGQYVTRIQRVGYASVEDTISFMTGKAQLLEFRLVPSPVPIAEVNVESRARASLGAMGGFWERRKRNVGHFFTRADIDTLRPHRTADLFRTIPGAQIHAIGDGQVAVFGRIRNIDSRPCVPAVFVDGVPYVMSERGLYDFSPTDLEAGEVYSGSARVPPEFNATGRDQPKWRNDQIIGSPRCGVIVFWMRRAQR